MEHSHPGALNASDPDVHPHTVSVTHTLTSTYRQGWAGKWLALTALVAVVAACGNDQGGTSVQDFMESRDEVDAITLSDIYDRDVSDVVIACAYTPAKAIRRELGFNWSGAKVLDHELMRSDGLQAVIALHEGEVVESEVILIDVLYLCHKDFPFAATTIDAGTTLQVSWSSMPWSDGTTKRIPVASIE